MVTAGLDAIFAHYVTAVVRHATITRHGGRWQATVTWLTVLSVEALDAERARAGLEKLVGDTVFGQLRHGRQLPVIDGINLNGGSC